MIKIFGSVLLFFYNICNSYGGAILLFGLLVKLIQDLADMLKLARLFLKAVAEREDI